MFTHPPFDDKTFWIIEWPFVFIFHFSLACLIINKAAGACLEWNFKSWEFHKWYSLSMSEQNHENSIWTSCESNYLNNFWHFCLESNGHVCQECFLCFRWVNPYDGPGCECRCFHFQKTQDIVFLIIVYWESKESTKKSLKIKGLTNL